MKTPLIFTAILAIGLLASCNTIHGAGKDIEVGGGAVAGAATEVQSEMQTADQDAQARKAEEDRVAQSSK